MRVKQYGFTVIELLVVIAIITITVGLTLPYYNNHNEEKKLETESKNFIDILNLARKKAVAADLGGETCNDFSGYKITANVGPPSTYNFRLCCTTACNTGASPVIQTYTFKTNISIDTQFVTFKPVVGDVQTSVNFIITNTFFSPNKCRKITVNTAGVIEEEQTCS